MNEDIKSFNNELDASDKEMCDLLASHIDASLQDATSKIWHRNPVWFLNGNPIVGYSKQKAGLRLMFWSGADFDESDLQVGTGKFKDASIFYTHISQVDLVSLQRWLQKAREIQWDYKNIVKNKGKLSKLR